MQENRCASFGWNLPLIQGRAVAAVSSRSGCRGVCVGGGGEMFDSRFQVGGGLDPWLAGGGRLVSSVFAASL